MVGKFNTRWEQKYAVVYTDGCCFNNGQPGARAGIGVYFNKDHPMNLSEPVRGRATNNEAEIQAAIRAIEQAKFMEFEFLRIYTDSQFMIDCMTIYIPKWKKNGWITEHGIRPQNFESLRVLDNLASTLTVDWRYIHAHSQHSGNDEADRLAKAGAALYKPGY